MNIEIPEKILKDIMSAMIYKALDGDVEAAKFVYSYAGIKSNPVEHIHVLSDEWKKLCQQGCKTSENVK